MISGYGAIRAVDGDVVPAARVRAVAADEDRRDGELAREVGERIPLRAVNPVRPQIDAVASLDASADPIASLEHGHVDAALGEGARRREPGQPRPDHEDSRYVVGYPVAADEQRDRLPHRGAD